VETSDQIAFSAYRHRTICVAVWRSIGEVTMDADCLLVNNDSVSIQPVQGGGKGPQLLSTMEVAVFLGVSTYTIKAWRKRGRFIRGYRLGTSRILRYRVDELEAWLREQREEPAKRVRIGRRLPCGKGVSI